MVIMISTQTGVPRPAFALVAYAFKLLCLQTSTNVKQNLVGTEELAKTFLEVINVPVQLVIQGKTARPVRIIFFKELIHIKKIFVGLIN